MAFHPRLPRLAVAHDNVLAVWDIDSGQCIGKMAHPAQVHAVAWHPRGHRLATASGREIFLWDSEQGVQLTEPWKGHITAGIEISFSPTGDRIVSDDYNEVLRLWDAGCGRLLLSLPGQWMLRFGTTSQSLGPRFAGDKWQTLRVAGGEEMRSIQRSTPRGREPFLHFSLHPDGRILAGLTPSGLAFIDLLTGEEVGLLASDFARQPVSDGSRRSHAFDSTGALWTIGRAGLLRWPVQAVPGQPGRLRIGPPEWIANALNNGHDGFATSPDGRVAVVPLYSEGALVVQRGPPRTALRLGPQPDVRFQVVSPDGRWVITGSHWPNLAGGVKWKLWAADTGRLVANLPESEVKAVHGFSPDGRWLYVDGKQDRRLEVASLAAMSVEPTPLGAAPPATPRWPEQWRSEPMRQGGTFSPDGALAAFGQSDGSIQLVLPDRADEEIARLPSPEVGRITPGGFSPDGALLLARGHESGTVYVFNLRRLREQLAELGLDWDSPRYRPEPPEVSNPAGAAPLHVELIGADVAANQLTMAEHDNRLAVARLFANPFDGEAHYRLGSRLLDAGKPEIADAHLGVALAFQPNLDTAHYLRAQAAFRLQRWEAAVEHATRYLEKCPFDRDARLLRVRANLILQRQYAEGVADLTELLARYPTRPGLFELRARCHEKLGRHDQAKADRMEAIKLGGDEPSLLNEEAWALLAGPPGLREPQRALELSRVAVAKQPGNAMFRNTLGVAEYRNGMYQQAVATLQKSLEGSKGEWDGFSLFVMAMCHARLGDTARAKDCFERAVKWVEGQKDLPADKQEELKELRGVAEELLRNVPPSQ
jgi:WD40 repeat protein/tetratricopeptide (TPR) repeat protein